MGTRPADDGEAVYRAVADAQYAFREKYRVAPAYVLLHPLDALALDLYLYDQRRLGGLPPGVGRPTRVRGMEVCEDERQPVGAPDVLGRRNARAEPSPRPRNPEPTKES